MLIQFDISIKQKEQLLLADIYPQYRTPGIGGDFMVLDFLGMFYLFYAKNGIGFAPTPTFIIEPIYYRTNYNKKPHRTKTMRHSGGPNRDRTDDLTDANRTLSQLSYRPILKSLTNAKDYLLRVDLLA